MGSTRFEMRLSERDLRMIERIRRSIAKHNPDWAKEGISKAGAVRHCLMACDPENEDDS